MSDLNDMALAQNISFRTKNANDNVLWKGNVKGFVDYTIARTMGDLTSYHTNILKADPTVGAVETLSYFVVELTDVEPDQQPVRVFAREWLEDGSFEILDEAAVRTLKIYDISTEDLDEVIELLQTKGYHTEVT